MSTRKFALGFSTLEKEVLLPELPVTGTLPHWLSGTLVRNGPAKYEVGRKKMRHWFDGFSMLHAFTIENGKVAYTNKFLGSKAYTYAKEHGTIGYSEFATDPCRTLFQRFSQMFSPNPSDNANVNISRIADEFVALTEVPLPIAFDPITLQTAGVVSFDDQLKGLLTSAHPHFDAVRKEGINYVTTFGAKSSYTVYHIARDSKMRTALATIPVKSPSYMHSFGLTENYVILAEYPFVVNPLSLMLSGKPFIENYTWKPGLGTTFIVVNRNTGAVHRLPTKAFFAFHHINAFEKDGALIVDLVAYDSVDIMYSLYLDVLRGETDTPLTASGEYRRYRLSLTDASVSEERLVEDLIELPRINYALCNTKEHRYVYGIGSLRGKPEDFLDRLVKVDTHTKSTKVWHEEGCYPGEPVFIPSPEAREEDSGVIVSVVLDVAKKTSFLLALDAAAFTEIARAEVPHHIPFGFHGQFYRG